MAICREGGKGCVGRLRQFRRSAAPFGAAVTANGLSSLGNLALTLACANAMSIREFGELSTALVMYALTTTVLRAAILENAARTANEAQLLEASGEVLWPSLISAVCLLALAASQGSPSAAIIALSLPGLALYDSVRTALLMCNRATIPLQMEAAWTGATIVSAVGAALLDVDVFAVVVTWAVFPLILVTTFCLRTKHFGIGSLRPRRCRNFSGVYALDSLLGNGSSQGGLLLLGWLTSTVAIGGIRVAGTLLSPVNVMATAVSPLLIRRIAVNASWGIRRSAAVAVCLGVAAAPIVLAANLIPDSLGITLFGRTWVVASELVLPISLEALLGAVAVVGFSGQRALGQGKAVLWARSLLGILRFGAIALCACAWGYRAAVWAMPAISLASLLVWWGMFYVAAVRKGRGVD